jgi:hypothetical protein
MHMYREFSKLKPLYFVQSIYLHILCNSKNTLHYSVYNNRRALLTKAHCVPSVVRNIPLYVTYTLRFQLAVP